MQKFIHNKISKIDTDIDYEDIQDISAFKIGSNKEINLQ